MNGKRICVIIQASLAGMAMLLACSGSTPEPSPDTINPGDWGQVSLETPEARFHPQDGRTGVAINAPVELYFNMDMDQDNGWKVLVAGVEYDRYSPAAAWQGRALVIVPAEPFIQGSSVDVTAEGFVSAAGTLMDTRTISFTVVQFDAPTVTITPTGSNVHPMSDVQLTFSQMMLADNGWSVIINGAAYSSASPGITWSGSTLTINPPDHFTPGAAIEVKAQGFVTKYGAVAMPAASASFDVDPTPLPTIGFDPNGSSDPVSRLTPLRLIFTEEADHDADWEVTLDGITYTKDSPGIAWGEKELIIGHEGSPLTMNAVVQAEAKGFFSATGYPMEDAAASFPVRSPLLTCDPAAGMPGISIRTKVTLSFDEAVSKTGAWEVTIGGTAYSVSENTGVCSWETDRKLVIDPPADFTKDQPVTVTATGFTTATMPTAFNDLNYSFTPTVVPVDGVSVTESITLDKGTTQQLTAIITPSNATNQNVTWTTSAGAVATVDADGWVTAVAGGNAVITVKTVDGGFTDTCAVTVLGPPDITLHQGDNEIPADGIITMPGSTRVGYASFLPVTVTNAGDKDLQISQVQSDHAYFSADITGFPITVIPGATGEFHIIFSPPVDALLGEHSALITLNSNDPDEGNYRFTVNATAVKNAVLTGTPDASTPNVSVSTKVTLDFSEPVKPDCAWTVSLTGSGSVAYAHVWNAEYTSLVITPTTTLELDVPVHVTVGGFVTADEQPFNGLDYYFTPTVSHPGALALYLGTDQIAPGGEYTIPARTAPGSASNEVSFTIKNEGAGELVISDIQSNDGHFVINSNGLPAALIPGETKTFGITFHPSAPQNYSGTITITSNDPGLGSFNFTINGWTYYRFVASMPSGRINHSAAAVNGKIYASRNTYYTPIDEYDPGTNTWTQKASSAGNYHGQSIASANGKVYLLGGGRPAGKGYITFNTVEEFDPQSNTFRARASMPTARYYFASATMNGIIYAIGGLYYNYSWTGTAKNVMEAYDPATDTWSTKATMTTARYYHSAAAANGKIYVIGGYNGGPLSSVEVYDIATDTWSSKSAMTTARYGLSAVEVNGRIYAIGGRGVSDPYFSLIEEYNPSTDTWTTMLSLPSTQAEHASVTMDGYVYIMGGRSSSTSGYLSTVLKYYMPAP